MDVTLSFFEIPATDFGRAVNFYQKLFDCNLDIHRCGEEKMAFFPSTDGRCRGAVSYARDFKLGADGILVSFETGDIQSSLELVEANGGKISRGKTAIDGNHGYFAIFIDCEGNRIGLFCES